MFIGSWQEIRHRTRKSYPINAGKKREKKKTEIFFFFFSQCIIVHSIKYTSNSSLTFASHLLHLCWDHIDTGVARIIFSGSIILSFFTSDNIQFFLSFALDGICAVWVYFVSNSSVLSFRFFSSQFPYYIPFPLQFSYKSHISEKAPEKRKKNSEKKEQQEVKTFVSFSFENISNHQDDYGFDEIREYPILNWVQRYDDFLSLFSLSLSLFIIPLNCWNCSMIAILVCVHSLTQFIDNKNNEFTKRK